LPDATWGPRRTPRGRRYPRHSGFELRPPRWDDHRIGSLAYIGHATTLIEVAKMRVLTDPLLRRRVMHIERRAPPPRAENLDRLDAVLISHAHHDHLDPPSLRRLSCECPVLVPRGLAGTLRRRGIKDVIEMTVGDRVPLGGIVVEAFPALHDGRRYPLGRDRPALGYVVEGPPNVYFAGDTDLFPEMEALAARIDVAVLPVAGWGPRVGAGHLDPERAARALTLIRPRIAVPIHWGTFSVIWARRPGRPLAPASAFARAAAEIAPEVDVRVLAPGEDLPLDSTTRRPLDSRSAENSVPDAPAEGATGRTPGAR
jgi:L-ascorbate metabolism protein UlaG (beta-lactamase superfamily)